MAQGLGTSITASQRVSTALPAAAATATPATPLDLGPQGGRHQNHLKIQISVPATPALVDAKTIIFEVTDCATSGGSYTAVRGYGTMVQTGAGGAGDSADFWVLRVHDHVKQYVKVTATVLAAGGDNTGVSYVMETIFDV